MSKLYEVTDEPKKPEMPLDLQRAEWLRQKRNYADALVLCEAHLSEHYDDVNALAIAAHILFEMERVGLAQPLLKRAVELADESALWNNLGLCYRENSQWEEGERCFIKALNRDPNNADTLNNLAQLYLNMAQPHKAINCADRALVIDPKQVDARWNRGQSKLMLKEWKEGWEGYEYNLGRHNGRRERIYGAIPRWDGTDGLNIIAYGEQGVGDELAFASCLPDLMKKNKVVIETDKRLAPLFRRSFDVPVYGTRFTPGISWVQKHDIDAAIAFGSLPKFYRNTDAEFPGTPYLKADPLRQLQWKAALASLGPKPKVGIAWTGGKRNTGRDRRSIELTDLLPVLRQDATFVSLQYMDAPEVAELEKDYGIKVHHWPYAVQTLDYDDTAALVAELDLVICVTTAVVDLAGGLGIPCWVLTPKEPIWRYGLTGTTKVWYKSVRLYRQTSQWVHPISEVATDLRNFTREKERDSAAQAA